jgi:hypothetical protein
MSNDPQVSRVCPRAINCVRPDVLSVSAPARARPEQYGSTSLKYAPQHFAAPVKRSSPTANQRLRWTALRHDPVHRPLPENCVVMDGC